MSKGDQQELHRDAASDACIYARKPETDDLVFLAVTDCRSPRPGADSSMLCFTDRAVAFQLLGMEGHSIFISPYVDAVRADLENITRHHDRGAGNEKDHRDACTVAELEADVQGDENEKEQDRDRCGE